MIYNRIILRSYTIFLWDRNEWKSNRIFYLRANKLRFFLFFNHIHNVLHYIFTFD